jgi:hypothetical protein
MTDETSDLPDDGWEKIEESLDQIPIPEQVASLENSIKEAQTKLFMAHWLAEKIIAAIHAGVLNEEEGERFVTTATESIKDLQAMLVSHWSGANSEREILEQLHHIYYPLRRLDGGLADTLEHHMNGFRLEIPFELMIKNKREGMQREYWERLRKYVESHPDEPPGWRESLRAWKAALSAENEDTNDKGEKEGSPD